VSAASAPQADADAATAEVDFAAVRLIGLMLIGIVFVWQVQFVHSRFFVQGDIVNSDIARTSGLSWHYLFEGGGQFAPGLRAVAWVLVRISLYGWTLDSAVLLGLAGATALACFRLMRTLFGDHPVILVPLAVYLLSPLVVPDLGSWGAAMRSQPLELATFMAVDAHVRYLRCGRRRKLAESAGWLAFAISFDDKAIVLPLLLFAITSAFLMETGTWWQGAASALRSYPLAWRNYGVLLVGYLTLLAAASLPSESVSRTLSSSALSWPVAPASAGYALLTGIIGGPWRWRAVGSTGLFAVASPPVGLIWLVALLVGSVLVLRVLSKPVVARAWLILAMWVVIADLALPGLAVDGHGLSDLADVAPVLAICAGLTFFRLDGASDGEPDEPGQRFEAVSLSLLRLTGVLLGIVFVAGSVWSVQTYENDTGGFPALTAYLTASGHALAAATPGTTVLDGPVPGFVASARYGADADQSQVIGDLETGRLAGRLRWVGQAKGTITKLMMFASDGRLYPALILGVTTRQRAGRGLRACWPEHGRSIVVRFPRATTPGDQTLQINYIWSAAPVQVTVRFGRLTERVRLIRGLNNAYLPVTGPVRRFVIEGARNLCVGGAEVGALVPV
jgi:hypothetical protein